VYLVAEHDRADAVADEDDIDSGLVHHARGRVIVGRQHRDLTPFDFFSASDGTGDFRSFVHKLKKASRNVVRKAFLRNRSTVSMIEVDGLILTPSFHGRR